MAGVTARVWVTWDFVDGNDLPLAPVSDEQGRLRVGPLPAGWWLEVLPTGETGRMAVNSDWSDLGLYALAEGEVKQLPPLVLNPAGRKLTGRVLANDGQPLANALVLTTGDRSPEPRRIRTDADGRFELTGLRAMGDVGVVAISPDGTQAYGMPCDPDLHLDVELQLQPLSALAVTVVDADGAAVAGARVNLWSPEARYMSPLPGGVQVHADSVTDANGQCRIERLVPGLQYWVSAHAEGIRDYPSAEIVLLEPVQEVRLQLKRE